jgi:IclR family transcriptional regulator, KDG regulon repressor
MFDPVSSNGPSAPTRDNSRYLTGSVQKAISLLKAFSFEKREYSLVELAHETGLNVSTTHRLLATLEAEALIERDPANGHYRLAVKMFELGSIVLHGMELNTVGTPILARLATETEDTTYFTVLTGTEILCVARIEGVRHSRSQFLAVGRQLPLHAGAGSKVLLADLPPAQVRQIMSDYPLTRYTESTITDPDQFMVELAQVREQGYALSQGEITSGIMAIAAPIRQGPGDAVAAISLSGSIERYGPENLLAAIERVRAAANQISFRLGYLPSLPTRVGLMSA